MPGKIRRFATRTIPYPIPLVFSDTDGKNTTEQFKVTYRSYSNTALEELSKLKGDEQGNVPYCDYLGAMVVSIVDADGEPLTNDVGEPAPMAREFFSEMSLADNAKVLYEAIQADINPQKGSPEGGADGSAASQE